MPNQLTERSVNRITEPSVNDHCALTTQSRSIHNLARGPAQARIGSDLRTKTKPPLPPTANPSRPDPVALSQSVARGLSDG